MEVRIREMRLKKGISQIKLAELVNDSQPNVVRWERGEISVPMLVKVAAALGCTVDELIGGDKDVQA
jgi:transcriptional regulator with XRE-family HTH domain